MAQIQRQIYILQMNAFAGGFYGAESDQLQGGPYPKPPESLLLLQGVLANADRLKCTLPLGLPSTKAIIALELIVPILTDEVVKLWRANGLTGWTSRMVDLHDMQAKCDIGIGHAISIVGRCGPVRDGQMKPMASGQRFAIYVGVFPELSLWDGSDFFLAPEHGYIFSTEKAKTVCENAKLVGIKFVSAYDLEITRPPP